MTQTVSIGPAVMQSQTRGLGQKGVAAAQDMATLLALLLVLPLNASLVLLVWMVGGLSRAFSTPFSGGRDRVSGAAASQPKTVLISGGKMTKALQLARSFKQAGHRVILIETHKYWLVGHRFSRAVDRFYTVSKPGSSTYADDLLAIVQRENVDLYLPVCSPVASYHDAIASRVLSAHCEVFHVSPDRIDLLDDKYQFAKAAESFGLSVPKSYKITHPQQVVDFDFSQETRPYILKSIPYDSVRRLDLTRLPCETPEATQQFAYSLPISPERPWIMQEFIPGQEYCTHSTLRNGELRMHCCCQSSAFQVNYEQVDKPEIETWVSRFAQELNLTGQASFDFIQAHDNGQIYAIECNPRTHSAVTMFYSQPSVAEAYLGDRPLAEIVQPQPDSRPTYWIYHEIWRLLTHLYSPRKTLERLQVIVRGKDAIFDWQDPLPFLMVHHWQIPLLLLQDFKQLKGWIRIDFNIGKLVQLGGD